MKALHYIDGTWHEGNPPIMGPMTHAAWLGSSVFDGARAFEGVAPDLDLHCQRVVNSAHALELVPNKTAEEILQIAWDGIARHPKGTALYIRPMFWGTGGFVVPEPDSTDFCLTLFEAPLPDPKGSLFKCDEGGPGCNLQFIGDDRSAYKKAFERLLRDLKAED